MWTHSIKLPIAETVNYDEDGFETGQVTEWIENIPANFTDATRDDMRTVYQMGTEATVNVTIRRCNYSGQKYLVDEADGQIYYVCRTFGADKSTMITLTCGTEEVSERWRG